MKKSKSVTAPPRVGLYVRVSGQEQAIKGLSLEAQQEDLEEYVKERGWIIAGIYIDAAKTARKSLGKRTNFLRMLEDVKQDKVDLILFTRLDRWFRSVADYYKVVEILDAHNCGCHGLRHFLETVEGQFFLLFDELDCHKAVGFNIC